MTRSALKPTLISPTACEAKCLRAPFFVAMSSAWRAGISLRVYQSVPLCRKREEPELPEHVESVLLLEAPSVPRATLMPDGQHLRHRRHAVGELQVAGGVCHHRDAAALRGARYRRPSHGRSGLRPFCPSRDLSLSMSSVGVQPYCACNCLDSRCRLSEICV